jgi:hypothetical protein
MVPLLEIGGVAELELPQVWSLFAEVVAASGLADGDVHDILVHPPAAMLQALAGWEIQSLLYSRQ